MSDATTSPQQVRQETGEIETIEQKPLARKWLAWAAIIIASGSAGGYLRSCLGIGAGVVGLQTTEKALEQQAKNDEVHTELKGQITKVQTKAEEAAKNSDTIVKGMPDSWKRRALGR